MTTDSNTSLDPTDWDSFREQAHGLLDTCIDQLANAADHPWKPVPRSQKSAYAIGTDGEGIEALVTRLRSEVLPYGTGNTHPRFFGWVHGTGLASGLLSELVAATMNSNCGGRDHGAVYLERAVVDWAKQVFGFPDTASGLLVAGTSQATVIACAAARVRALGANIRADGQREAKLVAYAGSSIHSAAGKALELLGIGLNNLRKVPDDTQGLDPAALVDAIEQDRRNGAVPFMIFATAGSVDLGRFDNLTALAAVAQEQGLWLHVDGAFGAWTRLADEPWKSLSDGIELADSLACDFHKWMYVPYDCGMVLIRNEDEHRAAFAGRPSYLEGKVAGIGGGDPWFCDYGIDLSRGNRALKVWSALVAYGPDKLGRAISENCRMAAYMGERVSATDNMSLAAPVVSNLCVFTADETLSASAQSELNNEVAQQLQLSGEAVFSTAFVNGITCLRAAITNHRTTREQVDIAVDAVLRARAHRAQS